MVNNLQFMNSVHWMNFEQSVLDLSCLLIEISGLRDCLSESELGSFIVVAAVLHCVRQPPQTVSAYPLAPDHSMAGHLPSPKSWTRSLSAHAYRNWSRTRCAIRIAATEKQIVHSIHNAFWLKRSGISSMPYFRIVAYFVCSISSAEASQSIEMYV